MEERVENRERRRFFGLLCGGAVSLAGFFAAIVAGGFLYPVRRSKPPPLFVCLESRLVPGKPLEIKDPAGRPVLLLRKEGGDLVVLGSVCPHLGCTVYYRPKKGIFYCPCHQGVFDGDGNPIAGPPQRPLQHYPTEVRGSKVFVQFA